MAIEGILQPDILEVDGGLRLRKYDGAYDFAFEWYRDEETVYLVDGVKKPYDWETLTAMYEYLNGHGELYFIEALKDGEFVPIGDVTFWQQDMPIVIGDKAYRGQGIGKRVISRLIERGRELGYKSLYVSEIYDFNPVSRKCFENMGFRAYEKTDKGSRFILELD